MSEDERERDSAPPGEVVVEAEDSGDGEEDWSPFEEIQEDFKPRPIPKVTAADGLPTQHVPVNDDDIPVLSAETLVCMGDYSEFVQRNEWGEIIARCEPEHVERMPNGRWRQRDFEDLDKWVEVEPLRPPCKHYARQLTQFDLNAQAQVLLRVCSARRTTEGAFMSLRDRAMWACELREPRDAQSFDKLQAFDERKMRQGERRELLPIFSTEPTHGIFGGSNGGE